MNLASSDLQNYSYVIGSIYASYVLVLIVERVKLCFQMYIKDSFTNTKMERRNIEKETN